MDKDFYKGIKMAFGFLLIISFLGIITAVGFHIADEIMPGTFIGNFIFDGDIGVNGTIEVNGSIKSKKDGFIFPDGTTQDTAVKDIPECTGNSFLQWDGADWNCTIVEVTSSPPVSSLPTMIFNTIASGYYHSCGIEFSSGALYCWGYNAHGELGDATTLNRGAPVLVSGMSSGVVSVAAGGYNTCAIKSDGKLYCWGDNSKGQVGDGSIIQRTIPSLVSGFNGGTQNVSVGYLNTCAIKNNDAYCWGYNLYGQVGDGTATQRTTPKLVLSSGVSYIASGASHNCAIKLGELYCWGYNNYGQLGDGSLTQRNAPIKVSGLGKSVDMVGLGISHSCAIENGAAYCWGLNNYGQLGDGSVMTRVIAYPVSGFSENVQGITGGGYHTCAVKGDVGYCWGQNNFGQLGDATNVNKYGPVTINGFFSGISGLSTGIYHTCGIKDNNFKCWGQNNYGQVGDGSLVNKNVPTSTYPNIVSPSTCTLDGVTLTHGQYRTFYKYNHRIWEVDCGWSTNDGYRICTNGALAGSSTLIYATCTWDNAGGSCPYLYLWNGTDFAFEIDLYGSGALAYKRGKDIAKPIPNRIYQLDNIVPRDGNIEFRIFEDLDEIDYFDRLQLLTYLVPENITFGISVPALGEDPNVPLLIHSLSTDLIEPIFAVRLDTNENILNKVLEVDEKEVIFSPDSNNFSFNTFEIDFGDISKYKQKKLVIVGETVFPKSPAGIERRKLFSPAEYMEVINESGDWERVDASKMIFAKPISFESRQAVDISNIFITDDYRIRITYLYKTYINQIAFDGTTDIELPEPQMIPMDVALLRGTGIYHKFREDGEIPFYNVETDNSDYEVHKGSYTKYGDIQELLEVADDKFVIMARGDELLINFTYPTENIPEGYRKLFIIDTWGYYKSGISTVELVVDPLPFNAMSNYPYLEEEYPYNENEDYQNYLNEWNTRTYEDNKIEDLLENFLN